MCHVVIGVTRFRCGVGTGSLGHAVRWRPVLPLDGCTFEMTSLWIRWIASQIGGSPEAWLQMQCTGIAWRSHRMETPDRWIARGPCGGRRLSSRFCFWTLVLSLLVAVRARRLLLLSKELCVPLHSSRYLTGWRDRSEAAFLNATAARRSGCSRCAFARGTWRPGWAAGGGAAAGRLVGD